MLGFYDWEAEVLGPNGKPVASQIPSPDPAVLGISQGAGSSAPGEVGAGCVSLAQALALAAKADADAPRHTEYIGRMRLRVPIPYVVLEAASAPAGRPTDGFFVLRITRSVLSGEDITNPRARSDGSSGAHSVTFGFTAGGRRAFQSLTAGIARRGSQVSSPGQTLNQHFAIVLDNQLIGVPYIDYRVYPDGIKGENGADISGDFTTQFARDLAILLRYGPLPVQLTATG